MDNHLVYMEEIKEKDKSTDFFITIWASKMVIIKNAQLKAFELRFSSLDTNKEYAF